MLKRKIKNSLISLGIIALMILLTGCVNQEQTISSNTKIAATSVTVCEILDALDVESEKIIAVPESESYTIPEKYQNAATIGSPMSPDIEKLADLKPSIVLSPNSLESDLATKYENASLNSAFLNLKSVNGMFKSIEELGTLLDKQDQANKLVDEFVDYMSNFKTGTTKPKILILMGLPGSYVVATSSSYVGNLCELAGGENIYGDGDGQDFINVSVEDMLEKQPDLILRTSHAMPEQVAAMFENEFKNNSSWQNFEAVKNNKVYDLENGTFGMSANLQYQTALEKLREIFYGKQD